MTFTAAAVILCLLAGVSRYTDQKLEEATNWVTHTLNVINAIEQFKDNLSQAESAQRGYLLQRKPVFLETRAKALNAAENSIQMIEQLTLDNIKQIKNIHLLRYLLAQRVTMFFETQAVRDSMQVLPEELYLEKDASLSAELQDITEKMTAEEKHLLVTRNSNELLRNRFARGSLILLVAALLMVLSLLARRIFRDIRRQEQSSQDLTRSGSASLGKRCVTSPVPS